MRYKNGFLPIGLVISLLILVCAGLVVAKYAVHFEKQNLSVDDRVGTQSGDYNSGISTTKEVDKSAPVAEVKPEPIVSTNKTNSTGKSVKAREVINDDLENAKEVFFTCRKAFENADEKTLDLCLSADTKRRMASSGVDRYIKMWQGSFETCGGYYRLVVEVLNYYKFVAEDGTVQSYDKTDDHAFVYFKDDIPGCDYITRMIKENGNWKFNES